MAEQPKTLSAKFMSSRGVVLSPVYLNSTPPKTITRADRIFDPRVDHKTDNPEYVTTLRNKSAFSQKFSAPIELTMVVKSAQSDQHYFSDELNHLNEFWQTSINAEGNRSSAFFTQVGVIQVYQGIRTPFSMWHFDFGRTYLARNRNATNYLIDHPFLITRGLKRLFQEQARDAAFARTCMQDIVDWKPLEQGTANIRRFRPFDVVTHNHMTLHKGSAHSLGTLVTLSYIDDWLIKGSNFEVADNPVKPGLLRPVSRPIAESGELLADYVARLG